MTVPDRAGRLPIHYAAADNNPDVLRTLIAEGQDVNTPEGQGWTPLHFAADRGHLEIAKILLDAEADVTLTNNQGKTALDRAVATPELGGLEAAKLIFLRGGDPLHKDSLGGDSVSYLEMLDQDSRKKPLLEFFREHGVE